jgi:3-hydroxyacyl-CoA dehydrogenase
MIEIKQVAVLGAGVMGRAIAAHFANAGLTTYLFDRVPENELNRNIFFFVSFIYSYWKF